MSIQEMVQAIYDKEIGSLEIVELGTNSSYNIETLYPDYIKYISNTNFFCKTKDTTASTSIYENNSNGTLSASAKYTAPVLSYDISTHILTVTPGKVSVSASHNPASTSNSDNITTTVYMIKTW